MLPLRKKAFGSVYNCYSPTWWVSFLSLTEMTSLPLVGKLRLPLGYYPNSSIRKPNAQARAPVRFFVFIHYRFT
ncbi:hypothetical protein Back11_44440 [Paenibacillus baekrokdamisoli]|uniref:Uncharacterized protein n=1 Tax=Paenibacillus baekrokdamisoli TaxID=1712516 RepID=A0A3G9JJA5_9BACL|nr:hypothetical protein Back11_44440 [Paenibacillus baekrokdamisoli]